jgi:DNA-binding transcriptional LysR family regulator
MDLRQLRALVTVAEVGSVTRAARLLHLVQPAVTRQIRLLETEFGVELFSRSPSGMVPTPEGELLVERARRALLELERARAEIAPAVGEISGIVTIGILESVVDVMVPGLVEAIARRHPKIHLRILTAYSGHLERWLEAGDVDVSVVYNLVDAPSLSVTPILRENLCVVGPADAGLTSSVPVSWADAFEHPLVLPVSGHGLRALIEQARSTAHLAEPHIAAEANNMYVQKCLVHAGRGWTILPAVGVAGDVAAGVLSAAPLAAPEVLRTLGIGHQRVARTPRPVQAVAAQMMGFATHLVRSGAWPSARLVGAGATAAE